MESSPISWKRLASWKAAGSSASTSRRDPPHPQSRPAPDACSREVLVSTQGNRVDLQTAGRGPPTRDIAAQVLRSTDGAVSRRSHTRPEGMWFGAPCCMLGRDTHAMGMELGLRHLAADHIRACPGLRGRAALRAKAVLITAGRDGAGPYTRLDSGGYQRLLAITVAPNRLFQSKASARIMRTDDAAALVRGRGQVGSFRENS